MKLGIVGTGIFARDGHLPALQGTQDLGFVAAHNRTKAKAEAFAELAGFTTVADSVDELINDPNVEAIDALLPVEHNLEIVKKALASGKPLCFEKPIAHNLEDAREIARLTEKSPLPIMVLENWLYHGHNQLVKSLVSKIGEIKTFSYQSTFSFRLTKYHDTPWRQNPKHVGGYLSDHGVHEMALLTDILGDVKSVNAHTTQMRRESGDSDTLSALFLLESGVSGTVTLGSAFGATVSKHSFQIFGSNGSVVLEFFKNQGSKVVLHKGSDSSEMVREDFQLSADPVNGLVDEFNNFNDAVARNDKTRIIATPQRCFHHFAIIVAAVESAQKGGDTVQVPSYKE